MAKKMTTEELAVATIGDLERAKFGLDSDGNVCIRVLLDANTASNAVDILFDKTNTGLVSDDVQSVIEEINNSKENSFVKLTAFNKNFGNGSGEVSQGDHNHDGVYATTSHNHDTLYAALLHNHDITALTGYGSLNSRVQLVEGLLTSDDNTLDELQEVVDFITANRSDLDNLTINNIAGLQTSLDGKATLSHTHIISDITSLQTTLNGKLEASDITGKANLSGGNSFTGSQYISTANVQIVTTGDNRFEVNRNGGYNRLGYNYILSSDVLRLFSGGTEAIRIDNNQNIGVGTTNPGDIRMKIVHNTNGADNYGLQVTKTGIVTNFYDGAASFYIPDAGNTGGAAVMGYSNGSTAVAGIRARANGFSTGVDVRHSGNGTGIMIDNTGNGASLWIKSRPDNDNVSMRIQHFGVTKFATVRNDDVNGDNTLYLNGYYIWVDGSGRLKISSGIPSSDTSGTIIGTQS